MATDVPADARLICALDHMAANPEMQRVREVAFAALHLAPGQRILDAGAGTGEVARWLATRLCDTGSIVALDASEAAIAAARARDEGTCVQYLRGDVTALDFPDHWFDAVRCERVLQHLAEPGRAVAELARVTRAGGRVCLVDTDWESVAVDGLPRPLVARVREHLLATVAGQHLDMGRTLRRRLHHAGLHDVTAVPVALYFPDPIAAAAVLPMVNPMVPAEAGLIPGDLREDWFGALSEAGERGDFLATLTMWVAAGTV
ncbi:methyltransferase domain-containing protein [Dactylosporangium sp. NPDC049140]|jgi:SAM-dependent methyltransferase|uniref:methyltransferase domain-containing protein n=1 Tax=Dactylosporangium sp. NPDC049140 TaxID=3155647 RepID=UPI0033DD6898